MPLAERLRLCLQVANVPVNPARRPQVTRDGGRKAALGPESRGWSLEPDTLWLGELGNHCLESISSAVERGPSHAPHSLLLGIIYNYLQCRPLSPRAGSSPSPTPSSSPGCTGSLGKCPTWSRCSVICHSQLFLGTMLRGSSTKTSRQTRGQAQSLCAPPPFTLRLGRGVETRVSGRAPREPSNPGHHPPLFLTAGPRPQRALFVSLFLGPCLPGSPPSALHRPLLLFPAPCARPHVPTADGSCFPSPPGA